MCVFVMFFFYSLIRLILIVRIYMCGKKVNMCFGKVLVLILTTFQSYRKTYAFEQSTENIALHVAKRILNSIGAHTAKAQTCLLYNSSFFLLLEEP